MKKWRDVAPHRAGCPYRGVAVYGTEQEMAKYYSGNCPGCNIKVRWQEMEHVVENLVRKDVRVRPRAV